MEINEIARQVSNIAQIGVVCEIDPENRALAKVETLGRITDFMPVLNFANSYKRKFSPVRVGEQVLIICIKGNADNGIILGGIFNTNCKEPEGSSENIEITEYEDGTIVKYDVENKKLTAEAAGEIDLTIKGNVNISADGEVNINKSGSILIKSDGDISIDTAANMDIKAAADINLEAENINLKASKINLN